MENTSVRNKLPCFFFFFYHSYQLVSSVRHRTDDLIMRTKSNRTCVRGVCRCLLLLATVGGDFVYPEVYSQNVTRERLRIVRR